MMSTASIHLLILVIVANSAPVLLTYCLGDRFARPIDGGLIFFDGRPLFGSSKTWRGLIGAALSCAIVAPLLGYSVITGILAGGLAMLGDLLSSFTKRRVGLTSSAQAPLLDQIPEAIIPAIVLKSVFMLTWRDIVALTAFFIFLEIIFSVIFYQLGIRKKPY